MTELCWLFFSILSLNLAKLNDQNYEVHACRSGHVHVGYPNITVAWEVNKHTENRRILSVLHLNIC